MKQIPLFKVYMSKKASKNAAKVINSGFIGQGPVVDQFEKALRNRFNHKYIVTTNSATSAEHLAIRMLKNPDINKKQFDRVAFRESKWLGIQPGDEALCTALTCTATNFPVLANDLRIKWVDVNPNNLNMDLDDLERKLSPTTKIIYLVHWGGYPVDLDRVKRIQDKCYKLYGFKPAVIEDCAHAFGSKYKNIPIGSYGNYSTFSFQAIKHLTSVDGGILICPHEKQYKRARVLRWYGIDRDDNRKDFRCEADIPEWGYKFHMNDVNASIGLSNLKEVDKEVISKHKANAKYYNEQLKNVNGVTLLENKEGYDSAYWIYTLKVERQNDFMEMMKNQGIMVSRVHERNDKHTCVKEFRSSLPNLDKVVKEMICIPVGWWVTNEQREYIVKSIKQGW
jgi:dTDP-4-amino-4,6-dideoxygalactose transaminase